MPTTAPTRIERIEGTVMPVNSYIIEGPDGLVIIDGQLTVSDGRAVRSAVDGFDRPVAGLVVTHGHPDHYAGAATILDGLSAPIVSTSSVADIVARDDEEKDGIVGPMMGPEWPTTRRFPDEIVRSGHSVELGGLTFDVRALGPGESDHDTLWTIGDDIVFSGDIAYNDMHPYLLDGHFDEWIALLDQLSGEISTSARMYVGHGDPTDTSVLARQKTYVEAFLEVVSDNLDVTEAERHDAVVAAMRDLASDDRSLFLMELSIEPAASILSGERTTTVSAPGGTRGPDRR